MDNWGHTIIAFVALVIGLATTSVILSSKAQTSQVIKAGSQGLSSVIQAAVSPVTGYSGLSTSISPLG
jgi:hypothetical protein